MKPFFVTIPHSGERVPEETPWLRGLPETLLMYDVDRYVDRLYEPHLARLGVPVVKTDWHRYVVDLNRWTDDVDADSVEGHANPRGRFPRGLHWSITTSGEKLMPRPMPRALHEQLVKSYFEPFHESVRARYQEFHERGFSTVYHLDAHSMPSVGTSEHRDPGERRKDIVVSDCKGTSCSKRFLDLVMNAYAEAGFSVGYNWPYFGGRVTETYGRPVQGHEAVQVELNRALYMDETTKRLREDLAGEVSLRIGKALDSILAHLES